MSNYGWVFIIIAAVLWSMDGLLRRSLYGVSPLVVVFWEHALGSLLLLPFAFRSVIAQRNILRNSRVFFVFAGVSLFSGVLGTLFYTSALMQINYIQFSVVVLLQQLQPIFAIGAARSFLKEKVSGMFLFWATAALLGAYLVTFKNFVPTLATGKNTVIAAFLAIGAAAMWGISTSLSKIAISKMGHREAAAIRFILTALFSGLFILISGQQALLPSMNPHPLAVLLVISLTTGMVSLLVYYRGLARTSVRVSALCELAWPVSALLIDIFVFKQIPTIIQVAGSFLIMFSIYRVTSSGPSSAWSDWYRGVVHKGSGLGRRFGYRTINLNPNILNSAGLSKGVYAAEVFLNRKKYKGILYWGPKKHTEKIIETLEIHLFNFNYTIYGKRIAFRMGRLIRKPIRFSSDAELKAQLIVDIRSIDAVKDRL